MLETDGDALERRWSAAVLAAFPKYARFWAEHVVPLTWRTTDRRRIAVRDGLRAELVDLASSHYAVFCHLAACHEMLTEDGETFARRRLYEFYSRVYSARQAADILVGAVHDVLKHYGGPCVQDKRRRLTIYDARRPGLAKRYAEAQRRDEKYRGEQVHQCAFVTVGSKVPQREFLDEWTRLTAIDRLEQAPDRDRIVSTQFVEGLDQGMADLVFLERVFDDLWAECLTDLAKIKKSDQYRADQSAGGGRYLVPNISFNLSSQAASGIFVPPTGQQGPQGQLKGPEPAGCARVAA
ncbi:MAG: hypothetical protein ACRDI2_25030 [Chloroflexota bacterium]